MKTVFDGLIKKIETFQENVDHWIIKALMENKVRIIEMNKDQLLDGQNSIGMTLMPYVRDPFFKGNEKAAFDYARWKQRKYGIRSSIKPFDAPDLKLRGDVHNSMDVVQVSNGVKVTMNVSFPNDIEDKYPLAFGLQTKNIKILNDEIIQPMLKSKL